tara:strand:- start:590 stop:793 length:204 start_codon:yes stop_codon:yes gene_type:complete
VVDVVVNILATQVSLLAVVVAVVMVVVVPQVVVVTNQTQVLLVLHMVMHMLEEEGQLDLLLLYLILA